MEKRAHQKLKSIYSNVDLFNFDNLVFVYFSRSFLDHFLCRMCDRLINFQSESVMDSNGKYFLIARAFFVSKLYFVINNNKSKGHSKITHCDI